MLKNCFKFCILSGKVENLGFSIDWREKYARVRACLVKPKGTFP